MNDEIIKKEAILFVKQNKKVIINKFANLKEYPSEPAPFTIFMAGSPGAGKTEFSIGLRKQLYIENPNSKIVRIDADEIRELIPQYNYKNSHLIQSAASIGMEKLIDHIYEKKQNAIIDGTFAHYNASIKDIQRSVHRGRKVGIWYLYLDPKIAWDFTRKREILEGRPIRKADFITAIFAANENVNKAKALFGKNIELNLVIRQINKPDKLYLNINDVDNYLQISYNIDELNTLLI